MTKDFVNISDFTGQQLRALLNRALADKACFLDGKCLPTLARKTLAMIFEKPSLRTRVSFEVAMTQLGGSAIYLTAADIGLGSREEVKDMARVLGGMCDGVMARTFSHQFVAQLAAHAGVPVINGLTDFSHPCQAMADLMTLIEQFGQLKGRTIAFVGDGNNVARSLVEACTRLEMKFILACPRGYELREPLAKGAAGTYEVTHEPASAVAAADAVYADTWVSMGQEDQKQQRARDFAPYQINAALLSRAPGHAVVLHCLPAYRGSEITDEAFEAHAQTIFRQAANRLHFQRSLLNILIGEGGVM